jgi:dihydropteroate synthase
VFLIAGSYKIDLSTPVLMGILNVTPDSFSDGGLYVNTSDAVDHAKYLIDSGAKIIDIGAESSRPGSLPISLDEEKKRLFPILEKIVDLGVPVSVDSNKYEIMKESIKIGASMLNDINGFELDEKIELVRNQSVTACVMHKKGSPLKMQEAPYYSNILKELNVFFEKTKLNFKKLINENRLLLDPGIGFGKTFEHNKAIIKNLKSLSSIEVPLLVGISRKSFLKEFANDELKDRDFISSFVSLLAIINGAKIIRTHNIALQKKYMNLAQEFYKF